MYQPIYEFILNDLINAIDLPIFDGFDISVYVQYLSHALTITAIVLLFILCIKFIVYFATFTTRLFK